MPEGLQWLQPTTKEGLQPTRQRAEEHGDARGPLGVLDDVREMVEEPFAVLARAEHLAHVAGEGVEDGGVRRRGRERRRLEPRPAIEALSDQAGRQRGIHKHARFSSARVAAPRVHEELGRQARLLRAQAREEVDAT